MDNKQKIHAHIKRKERGSNLHLTLDDKREGLNIDFILSKESLEA